MTDSQWQRILHHFEQNQERLTNMEPAQPMPNVKWRRESAHRTLAHLTACQQAWLPLMRQLQAKELRGRIDNNPDPLLRQLGYDTVSWEALLERFLSDRAEWRQILAEADLAHELNTMRRTWSAQSLTKRLVDHEKNHLDQVDGG